MSLNSENFRSFFKFAGVLTAMVVLASGVYFVWGRYFREQGKQAAAFRNYQKQVEEAYKNDTYGGATPEETLRLFVEALKKEDVELASKYFALDDNLSRNYILDSLKIAKQKKSLLSLAELLKNAIPYPKDRLYENDYKFVVYEGSVLKSEINMELNPVSKVWKIESL